jgi:hypothetical protein
MNGGKDRQGGLQQSDCLGGAQISQVNELPLLRWIARTGRAGAGETLGGRRLQQSFP